MALITFPPPCPARARRGKAHPAPQSGQGTPCLLPPRVPDQRCASAAGLSVHWPPAPSGPAAAFSRGM